MTQPTRRELAALSLAFVLAAFGCGRSAPPPEPEPEPEKDPEPDPVLMVAVREAKESCLAVAQAVERVQTFETAKAAEGAARSEHAKLRKIRERLPAGLPPRTVSPDVAEFLEAVGRLAEAEGRLIDAIQSRRVAIPYDQLLIELRRCTDELQAIRDRVAPARNTP